MAINFLHNLDLSKNELQNAAMHPLTTNPGTPSTGQFYFNTANDVIRIYNGTAWVEFSSVSLATDTQQGTVKLFSNTDQTVAANSVTTTAGRTYGVQLNGSDQMVVNVPWVDTNTNQLTTFQVEDGDGTEVTISHAKEWKFVEGSGTGASIDINWTDTSNGSDGDPYDLTFTVTNTDRGSSQNIFKTFTVTDTDSGYTWAETGNVVADSNSDTVTFVSGSDIDIDVDAGSDAIRISHGNTSALNGQQGSVGVSSITVDDNGHVTAVGTDTYLTGNETISLSGDLSGSGTTSINATIQNDAVEAAMLNNNIISGQTDLPSGLVSTDEFLISDAGTIKRMDVSVLQTYMQSNLTFQTQDVDVSVANLRTRLGQISDDTTIGDATDVDITFSGGVVVTGDLTVSGTTTTVNTETINLADNIITLNSNYTGSSPSENGGIEIERGTVNNAVLRWNETSDRWEFTNNGGTNYYNIPVPTEYNNYIHPTHPGDDINIDTGALSGATVISDLDFNITTDGLGHVTDANAAISTRNITLGDLGFTGDSGADNYGGWRLQVNGSNTAGGAEVGSAEIVNFTGNTASSSVTGVTISNPSANVVNVGVSNASTTVRGGVELATSTETITGTDTSRAVTPDGLAATKVISTITIASLVTDQAEINHGFGTEDISVELYDQDGNTVFAKVTRGDIQGNNTTTFVTIEFNQVPAGITTVDAVIHSHRGATTKTASYS